MLGLLNKKSLPFAMKVICPVCHQATEFTLKGWRCNCGQAWECFIQEEFDPYLIRTDISSLWRYHDLFGFELPDPLVTLGGGWTPILPAQYGGRDVFFKCEYLNPSGTFKDRGMELMINLLKGLGAEQVVEDSSGNAGASLAAYAARAKIQAEIYAPITASPVKLSQIEIYGAKVHRIIGPRENSTTAVLQAVENGAVYASHAWNPAYLLGQQTTAWEVWEQLGKRAPDVWVSPVGQGGHFLGIWQGFKRLFAADLIEKLPCMIGVQSARMAPICSALNQHAAQLPELDVNLASIAEGVMVSKPVRWKKIIQAVEESQGMCIAVNEEDILPARNQLARAGFFVEPTSALAVAALSKIFQNTNADKIIVVSLTGSGLKVPLTNTS